MEKQTQTPLIDLLESVPRDAVLVVEHDQFSSSSHPVGRLCHEAAAELRRLHVQAAQDEALLRKAAHPAITHCDNCGCDWLDNGLNPVGCPYCKQSAEAKALREALAAMVSWFPSADTYRRLGFDPKTPMQVLKEAKALLFEGDTHERS